MMKCSLRGWPKGHHPPTNHMLITNDFKFYQDEVSAMQKPGSSVLLAYPEGDEAATSAAASFVPSPAFVWKFSKLLRGGPPDGHEMTFLEPEDDLMEFPSPNMPLAPSFCYDLKLLCDANTSVWWDIESCPVPIHCDATVIPKHICTVFGRRRPLTIFTDTSSIIKSSYLRLGYCKTAFKFVLAKYSSDDMMIAMREWAWRNPTPAICLLISGNEIYHFVLDELCSEGYEILLAHPDGKREISLASKASCVWEWSDLVHGDDPYRGSIL